MRDLQKSSKAGVTQKRVLQVIYLHEGYNNQCTCILCLFRRVLEELTASDSTCYSDNEEFDERKPLKYAALILSYVWYYRNLQKNRGHNCK